MKAKILLGVIVGVATATAAACLSSAAEAADDIVIGFAVAQSGPVAGYDDNGTKTAQIFIDDVNAKGGVLGKKLRAVFADTKSDRAEGAKAGQEVVSQGADLVIGTCDYDFGAPALLQAQKAGKISVFLCAEDAKAGVAGVGPYSFTAGVAAQLEGASLAEWGYDKQGYRDVYVLLDDSVEYTKSVCAGFDWLFAKRGGKIVDRDTFQEWRCLGRFAGNASANCHGRGKSGCDRILQLSAGRLQRHPPDSRGRYRSAYPRQQHVRWNILARRSSGSDQLLRAGAGVRLRR
jgi:branched-chain amino acid transport system substrate-binding protein